MELRNEAAAIAELIFEGGENRTPDDESRKRLGEECGKLSLAGLRPYAGSLEKDPSQASNYYLAVDQMNGSDGLKDGAATPLLLHFFLASGKAASLFSGPVFSEQLSTASGKEVRVNAYPFASTDRENIRLFAEKVNKKFLPRPQGKQPAVAAGNRHPEISLPAVLEGYRTVLEKWKVNMASTVQLSATREMTLDDAIAAREGEDPTEIGHTRVSIRHLYYAGLWAAIRAGWREGYTAEADHFIVTGNNPEEIGKSVESVKEAIRHAVGYTKFTTDSSRLFELESDMRHPKAWSDSVVAERFEKSFSADEQAWIKSEFRKSMKIEGFSYEFTEGEVLRLAVKVGQSLKLNEELFDSIRATKAELHYAPEFDFEPSIDEAETLTTAKELYFYMHWLKERGRPAQLVPPNLGFKKRQAYPEAMQTSKESGIGLVDYCRGKMWNELVPRVNKEFNGKPLEELAARVAELAAVVRHFDATLSIHSGSGKQPEVLRRIGKSTGGRVNYKISGELQLQLFDVLSEQPADSPWRQTYERMVARANRFAAAGVFGKESELAEKYIQSGQSFYLGDAARGRVDGNLFLVFWLGNLVGSRDVESPDGDKRFFKEKFDELPDDLLAEVRRRNAHYVVWLAEHLQG